MLPLIPAIIVLLLLGPSNSERLARQGLLPGAVQAIHQQLASPNQEVTDEESQSVLASLLARTNHQDISEALLMLLVGPKTANQASKTPEFDSDAELLSQQPHSHPSIAIQDGFQDCRRSRDGP